ncbi:MAG TPA: MFS transporter [Thermodesulfobacteriota bacterium]|nr:MFS transporter [Thermodesulfobacteriota bacterium]
MSDLNSIQQTAQNQEPAIQLPFDRNHRWWALATVGIGIFMATLDASIVNISLPSIMGHFKAGLDLSEWVILIYLLTITGLLLPFGRLADMIGRKKIFLLGFILFSLGSALCALSVSMHQLILFRAFQALGAAMLMANTFAIVTAVFPPKERGRALGINGTVVAAGFTIGPTLGGFLVSHLSWRAIFYVNVPVGIIGILMAVYVLQENLVSPNLGQRKGFDFFGAFLTILGLTALILGLTTGQSGRWGEPGVITELVIAGFILPLVPLWEMKAKHPLIDLSLFKIRIFSFGNIAGFLSFLSLSANVFLMPFFLQLALGYSPVHSGLLMTPTALAIVVVAPLSGWLSDRFGSRLLSTVGLAFNTFTLYWLSTLTLQATYHDVLFRLVILGIGQGLFQAPNNSSVMGSAPRERLGIASGFLAMARTLGQVVGTALAGTILSVAMVATIGHASLNVLHSGGTPEEQAKVLTAFMTGMHHAYLVAAAICFCGMWTSLVRGKSKPEKIPPIPSKAETNNS